MVVTRPDVNRLRQIGNQYLNQLTGTRSSRKGNKHKELVPSKWWLLGSELDLVTFMTCMVMVHLYIAISDMMPDSQLIIVCLPLYRQNGRNDDIPTGLSTETASSGGTTFLDNPTSFLIVLNQDTTAGRVSLTTLLAAQPFALSTHRLKLQTHKSSICRLNSTRHDPWHYVLRPQM